MNRRASLEWISRGLAATVAAVVGIPGLRYILNVVQSSTSRESQFVRLIRLKDVVPGRPAIIPVLGQKQDAWTRHDQQLLGRVWLVRNSSVVETADGPQAGIHAFSSVCPHMGCQIQSQSTGGFGCPCHRANFATDGRRLADPRTGERNHAPRDMDALELRLVNDETTNEPWVEVKYEKFKIGKDQREPMT